MFDWVCALNAGCFMCRNYKLKPRQRNEVSLKYWQNEIASFRTIHIHHKRPPQPPKNQKSSFTFHSWCFFLVVDVVTNTGAQFTISAVEKWISSFGIPKSILHDRGTAFINTNFINWTEELGITLRPRTEHSPWTKGKIEAENQNFACCCRKFLNDAVNSRSSLAPNTAFAHNTSVNYTTGKTPYDIVFGTKPKIPMFFLNWSQS